MGTRKTLPGAWPVLLAFTLVSAVTQLLWLNFAPLITLVMKRYALRPTADCLSFDGMMTRKVVPRPGSLSHSM